MDTFLGNEIGGEKNKSRERGMKKDIQAGSKIGDRKIRQKNKNT